MSAQVAITQLPTAGAITGTEAVPIVQNGVTVQTTTGAISASPSQTYQYLTVVQTPQLPNSRYVGVTNGLVITDAGSQGLFNISTTGALLSLVNSGTGFQVKTSSTAITGRSIAVTGTGLSIANGDGIAGNPTIGLAGQVLSFENLSANGLVTITTAGVVNAVTITGTTSQITVTNGTGISGAPTISLASNAILPGVASVTLPIGTTAERPALGVNGMLRYNTSTARFEGYQGNAWVTSGTGDGTVTSVSGTAGEISVVNGTTTPVVSLASNPALPGTGSVLVPAGNTSQRSLGPINGMFRYNSQTGTFEGYANNAWGSIVTGTGVTSVATGTGLTGGPITSTGTISIDVTGVTAATYGSASAVPQFAVNAQGQLTSASNVTISIPASAINTTIPNSGLTNSSVTYNGVNVALGASGTITATATNPLTIGTGLTGTSYNGSAAVTIAIDSTVATLTGTQTLTNKTISGSTNTLTNIANASLTNSAVTVGTTAISLGASSLTLGGLTSVAVTQDPVSALQLATKQYVDSVAQGLDPKASCVAATTANITLSGTQTIDGVALIAGDRCLVKNQTASADNGIYLVAAGAWTRATDMDTWAEVPGAFTFIEQGTLYADTGWVCTSNAGGTIGVTAITWVQFAGVGSYTAGTGLTLTGTQFSITNTAVTAGAYGSASSVPNYTVNAQGQLTLASNTAIAINANQITSGTLPVANGGTGRTVGNYSVYANEVHVSNLSGNDTTGDGTLINPVATITKALTLLTATSRTVIVHPGVYAESPTVSSTNTTITTLELTGANTELTGTLTLSAAARISGLKMANLTITGSGSAYISNCTVDTRVIKSGSNYVEIINSELQCTLGVQISGAGTVSIVGNKCWAVAVSNASANVLIKDCFQVLAPSVTAGTLQFDGCAIFAASPASNAITSSAGTFITLANSFVLNSAGNNVERVSLAGSYSIVNLVYDKTNSTFAGTNLNAIDYFSVINAQTVTATTGIFGGTF